MIFYHSSALLLSHSSLSINTIVASAELHVFMSGSDHSTAGVLVFNYFHDKEKN